MSTYRVVGRVGHHQVDRVVIAVNGAEAYRVIVGPLYPPFGRDWIKLRKEFRDRHVRLNITQIADAPVVEGGS